MYSITPYKSCFLISLHSFFMTTERKMKFSTTNGQRQLILTSRLVKLSNNLAFDMYWHEFICLNTCNTEQLRFPLHFVNQPNYTPTSSVGVQQAGNRVSLRHRLENQRSNIRFRLNPAQDRKENCFQVTRLLNIIKWQFKIKPIGLKN